MAAALTVAVAGPAPGAAARAATPQGVTAAASATAAANDDELAWAPPPLTNPVTMRLGTGLTSNSLDDNTDYIIKLPDTVKTGATILKGGHNVVIMGGHIRLPVHSEADPDALSRAIYIEGNTGTVHIEGVLIDAVEGGLGDAIVINAPKSIVQIENVRVDNLKGTADEFHCDVIQPWGGVKEVRVDKLSASSTYQGLFIPRNLGDIGTFTVRRTNITALPELVPGSGGGYMLWMSPDGANSTGQGPFYGFTDFYVQPRPDRVIGDTVWPWVNDPVNPAVVDPDGFAHWPTMTNVTGGAHSGMPPGGDYVPDGVAGVGYASPGYDSVPPQVVTGVTAESPFSTEAQVAWNTTTDNVSVTGYKLYRDGAEVADLTGTSHLDTDLAPGTTYEYTVRAYDPVGNLSPPSAPATVTTIPLDRRPPTSPPRFKAVSANSSQVTLTWDRSRDNLGVVGYEVRRDSEVIARFDGTTYTDSGLTAGAKYRYEVRAFDRTGNLSDPSKALVRTRAGGTAMPYAQDAIDAAVAAQPAAYSRNGPQAAAAQASSAAMYALVLAAAIDPAYRSTSSVLVTDRALAHIRNVVSGEGHEPGCSGGIDSVATSYAIHTFAVARTVPAIWNALTAEERERITLIVQACLVGAHYVYDDDRAPTKAIDQVSPVDKQGSPGDVAGGAGIGLAAALFLGATGADAFLTGFDADAFRTQLQNAGLANTYWVFSQAPAADLNAATRDAFTYRGHGLGDPFAWVNDRIGLTFSKPVAPFGAAGRGYLLSGSAELPNVCEPGMVADLDGQDSAGVRSDLRTAALGWGASVAELLLLKQLGQLPDAGTAGQALRLLTVAGTDIGYKAEHGYHSWSAGADRGDYDSARLNEEIGYQLLDGLAAALPTVSEPAATDPACAPNVALGAPVDVSSRSNADSGGGNAVDGVYADSSRWLSAATDNTPTITVNLGSAVDIRTVAITSGFNWPNVDATSVLVDFTVEVHTADGWQQVAAFTDNTAVVATTGRLDVQADQVRVVITRPDRSAAHVARVYEVTVYGTAAG